MSIRAFWMVRLSQVALPSALPPQVGFLLGSLGHTQAPVDPKLLKQQIIFLAKFCKELQFRDVQSMVNHRHAQRTKEGSLLLWGKAGN